MKKSTIRKLLIIAAIILVPVLYWKISYPSYTYRYKMTVEVETPQGLKTGSSVVEVHTKQWPYWMSFGSGVTSHMDIKGEGTIVDIAEGKTLFFLLGGGNHIHAKYIMSAVFPLPNNFTGRSDKYYGTLKNAKGFLPKDKHLAMVSAIQSGNGKTEFQVVNDEQLKEVFGTDIKIKQVIIETTNDPVEWKIRKLPMWNEIREYVQYMMTASSQRRGNSVWLIFSADLI